MVVRQSWYALAFLIGTTGSAHALKPGTHAEIAKDRCVALGLPSNFCQRAATENYDTDSREWGDLRAHAQIDDGETACVAADRTAERMWQLGDDLRRDLAAVRSGPTTSNVGLAANAFGRALHTIQDNCAHHGMPNPQHAWFSVSDFCLDTQLSPDIQSDATTCAGAETDAIVRLVADAVRAASVAPGLAAKACPPVAAGPRNTTEQPVCQKRILPGPGDACRFLASAKDWDGMDRTWANDVVADALRQAFAAGLAGRPNLASMCGGNETVLSPAVSQPVLDISGGAPTCGKVKLLCLGSADAADNPFFDDEYDAPAPEDASTGGCSTSGPNPGLLWLIAVGLFARRRRTVR